MIRWLIDPAATDRRATGGKAATLARLRQAGFDVPDGFCIEADMLRRAGTGGELPGEAREAILTAYRELGSPAVAVRSSAVEEDGFEHSFSGVYETRLNVSGEGELFAAIAACLAAYDTAAAQAYRADAGVGAQGGLALLVQPMQAAQAAGVVFTGDPAAGKLGRMVISATLGLGEPLVAGAVDGDQWVLSKDGGRVLSRHIGRKELRLDAVGGARQAELDALAPALNDGELARLLELALEVEAACDGFPQDIEWVLLASGAFRVMQSRPIPTLAAAFFARRLELWRAHPWAGEDDATLWTRAYADDVWTRPTSPLFYTIHNLTGAFAEYFRVVGHTAPLPEAAFRYHLATAYLDVRYLEAQAEYQPRFARGEALLGMLPPGLRRRADRRRWNWRGRLRQAREFEIRQRATASITRNDRVVDALWPGWLEVVAGWREVAVDAMELPALSAHLVEVFEAAAQARGPCDVGVLFHHFDLTLLLKGLLHRWLDDEGSLFAAVTSGLEGSETVAEAHALWEIGQAALRSPSVADVLRSKPWHEASAALDGSPGGQAVGTALEAFLATHYHRGANYKDVIWPRWGDDPGLLLASLRPYLDAGAEDPAKRHRRQAVSRARSIREVRRRLRKTGPLGFARDAAFAAVLRYAHRYLSLRDNHRFYFDFVYWELRRTYRAMGRRLAANGSLAEADDVFFLAHGEIRAAAAGKLAPEAVRHRAGVRKRQYIAECDAPAPRFLRGDEPLEEARPVADETGQLRGLAAGAGRVTAVARVVTEVSQLTRLAPGEVLVAFQTDPGWTPWFSRIGGLVLETGSVLAHGASLAREYGLPAVTAVAGATARVPDGALVTVDGARGTVVIHEGRSAGEPQAAP